MVSKEKENIACLSVPPHILHTSRFHEIQIRNKCAAEEREKEKRLGGRLMTNWIELTFAFAPCGGPTNSLRACQGFCCSPAPLQPDAGRNPVIRRRLKFASPSGSRDIAVAHSVVSGYLFCEQKTREKRKELSHAQLEKSGHLSSLISTRKRRVAPAGWKLGY